MTDDDLRALIIEHARDIEPLTLAEMFEVGDDEIDTMLDKIGKASITVSFEEAAND